MKKLLCAVLRGMHTSPHIARTCVCRCCDDIKGCGVKKRSGEGLGYHTDPVLVAVETLHPCGLEADTPSFLGAGATAIKV